MRIFLVWLGFCAFCRGGDYDVIYRFAQNATVFTVKESPRMSWDGKGPPELMFSFEKGGRSTHHASKTGKLMGVLMEGLALSSMSPYSPTVKEVGSGVFVAFHNDGRVAVQYKQNVRDVKPWLEVTMSEAEANRLASSIRNYFEEVRLKRIERR